MLEACVPVPFSEIACNEGLAAIELLASVAEAVSGPRPVGMKLILKLQLAPAASDELPVQSSGVPLSNVCAKLVPTVTPEIARLALPVFWTVTDCGLSLLVPPTGVDWKFNVGACERSASTTWLSLVSAMNTSPDPSTATAHGPWNPLPTVGQPACGQPPTGTSATTLFTASATNISPAASTAIPIGEPKTHANVHQYPTASSDRRQTHPPTRPLRCRQGPGIRSTAK